VGPRSISPSNKSTSSSFGKDEAQHEAGTITTVFVEGPSVRKLTDETVTYVVEPSIEVPPPAEPQSTTIVNFVAITSTTNTVTTSASNYHVKTVYVEVDGSGDKEVKTGVSTSSSSSSSSSSDDEDGKKGKEKKKKKHTEGKGKAPAPPVPVPVPIIVAQPQTSGFYNPSAEIVPECIPPAPNVDSPKPKSGGCCSCFNWIPKHDLNIFLYLITLEVCPNLTIEY